MKSNFSKPTGWRISRKTAQWIIVAAVLLLGIRIALPYAIKAYVNHVLNKSPDYGGSVGDLNMQLWRGGYQIRQIQIFQKNSQLFSAAVQILELRRLGEDDGARLSGLSLHLQRAERQLSAAGHFPVGLRAHQLHRRPRFLRA